VLLLGVAYKKDIDDLRESPALDILRLLQADGADVSYHDPFVPRIQADEDGNPDMESIELTDEALTGADAVVILTDHTTFDYAKVVAGSRVLVDARNATRGLPGLDVRPGTPRWVVKKG
jgi:UDP-N-acetyl-D-glucosamine dehydrogenase